MSRRWLPADLPHDFRYPLIPPEHDRASFADYDLYDDDGGRSRESVVYPNYQPRERSPAPQIVRVAQQQPEMVRRQSLRPFSSDWDTFDPVGPSGDSKVPGSFHDTDAEDRATKIIDAVSRGASTRAVDEADLYSDDSENLDFGRDEPLVFPQLPLDEVVREVAHILRTRSNPAGEGYTYVFADHTGRNKFYKIGGAKNVSNRVNDHQNICNISYFSVQKKPATPLRQYKRLEKLAQAELINMSYDPRCVCGIQQRQYFWGSDQTAFEILDFWSKWLDNHAPYDKHGYLLPFWEYRLRVFEANIDKSFDCKGPKCMKHTGDTVACPICLRTGWKAWAEPSGLDKIEFVSRTQIKIQWVHNALLYLYKYVPIQDSVWVYSIDGIASAISMCDRFKSPTILLNLLYARLLIPIVWSTLFTTADYVSIFGIIEIMIYSGIWHLVRLQLAQLGVRRRGTESSSKDGRRVRRKALPSTSGRAVDEMIDRKFPREPSILEIPDERVENILQKSAPSSINGHTLGPVPVILPSEAAARLKRYKPGRRRSDFV